MKQILKPYLLLYLILSIISCNFSRNNEIEPNNTFAGATPAKINSEYSGTLDSEKDIDNYLLEITESASLRIDLSGIKGINNAFTLYRIDGSASLLLKRVDDNRKSSPEEFANLYVTPGKYIISVHQGERDEKKGNPDTKYVLKITSEPVSNEENEPNDDPEHANTIIQDSQIRGYFSPARNPGNEREKNRFREEDWYSFEINPDENNPVVVSIILSGVQGVDSVLELYDSSLNLLDQSDTSGSGGGESFTAYGLHMPGKYYVVAASKNFLHNASQPYTINMKCELHEPGTELEPDNSFEQALPLSTGEITGKINSAGDNDYYVFNADSKGSYRIELVNEENSDTILAVFTYARKKIFEINNSGIGGSEVIPDIYIKEPVYILVTSPLTGNTESGYKLSVSMVNSALPVEMEPNNTKNDAMKLDGTVRGYTTIPGDIDYFIVRNEGRKNYIINFTAPSEGAVKISTTDQQGYIIKTKELKKSESARFNEIFEKKGYIIIETVIADFDNPYELSIEEIQ